MRPCNFSSQPQLCVWRVLLALSLFVVGAVPAAAQTIRISNGNNQSGIVATPLPNPLVVKVRSVLGVALPGVTVTFTASSGGGSVTPASAVTDSNGLASTRLTLGTFSGTNRVVASASGIGSVTFSAIAKAGAPAGLALTPANTSTKVGVAVSYSTAIKDSYG